MSILASVGCTQPDWQELTIKGDVTSRRITEASIDAVSDGGAFAEISDPRAVALKPQLDDFLACIAGKPHRLAIPQGALRAQKLVETMLAGTG